MQETSKLITIALYIISLLFFSLHLDSQVPYNFVRYSNTEGFNQNTIYSIEQDESGFLWIGTSNGLIKYDGYDFINHSFRFPFPHVIPQHGIKNVFSCSKGIIWIASKFKLHAYSLKGDKIYDVFPGSMLGVNRIKESKDGTIWVFGENHVHSLRTEILKDSVVFYISANLLSDIYKPINITDLVQMNERLFIMTSNRGLYRLHVGDSVSINQLPIEPLIQSSNRAVRLPGTNNLLWIGTTNGLAKTILDNDKLHLIKLYQHSEGNLNSLSDNSILDIALGNSGELWIGTERGGLSMYREQTDDFVNYGYNPKKENGISSAQINCIYIDNFNVVWLGTAQGGLCKLDLQQKMFINLNHNPFDNTTLPGDLISIVLEDSKGYLWVSSYNDPLSRSKKPIVDENISSIEFERFNNWFNSYKEKTILSIFEDQHGYIWLGYWGSLVVYNPLNKSFKEVRLKYEGADIDIHNIRSIIRYGDNKIIFSGTGVTVVQNPWKYINSSNPEIPVISRFILPETLDFRNTIESTFLDSKNNLWVGTRNNGLIQLEFSQNEINLIANYKNTGLTGKNLNLYSIFCIYEDTENNIWFGTFGGGLYKLSTSNEESRNSFECLGVQQGLPDETIYAIIPENDSTLWLSTDMGICQYNIKSGKVISYNINDGILSNNYRRNAYFKGASGYLYFGGLNGLTVFKPESINPNLIPPNVRLVDLEINNQKYNSDQNKHPGKFLSDINRLILSHKENSIGFEMLIQHNSSPSNNRISYYLDGFDNDWIKQDIGKCKHVYTNISPGNYIFKVTGFNADGIKVINDINLPITILSPWYKRWWSYILFGLLIVSASLGIFLYLIKMDRLEYSLNYEQKDKERIQQVNQAKLQFFTSISHEFRTPLSLISATFQLFDRHNLTNEQKKDISLVDKNTNRLLILIDQLLTFRKSEQGHLKLKPGIFSLGSIMFPIAEAFENYSINKGVNFFFTVKNPDTSLRIDYEQMERVLFNILSNAFKFTPVGGTIKFEGRIEIIKNSEYIRFDIIDNGKGIPKEELNNVFNRFYQLNTEFSNVGTGIGLSLSKTIVELHKGFIEVESEPNIHTRFSVLIPKNSDIEIQSNQLNIQKNRIEEYLSIESLSSDSDYSSPIISDPRQVILIVDDDKDFRDILKKVLNKEYKLLEAEGGLEAIEKVKAEEPDLIVSDVMMPEMNGYELCKKIKSDIQLCHIPIILLTAMSEDDMHIKGLEFGADSYIAKPFNVKYLKVTIKKIIENRMMIKDHFTKSFLIPSNLKLSSIDQNFIEKANKIIEQNLDNSEFGVEMLSKEVGLSPSQLYRKLKQFTGQVPNAYIRNYRLQIAAQIIRSNPDVNLKNVMFDVGIESPSYFAVAFKKKFGVLPSEYHLKQKDN
jgi:signal transduction histidine kinase/DNA-binding response OmpR family regulator/ligand-binding sensor domain-containing protein